MKCVCDLVRWWWCEGVQEERYINALNIHTHMHIHTYLMEHQELGVAFVEVVLVAAHFDIHVEDGVSMCVCVLDECVNVRDSTLDTRHTRTHTYNAPLFSLAIVKDLGVCPGRDA